MNRRLIVISCAAALVVSACLVFLLSTPSNEAVRGTLPDRFRSQAVVDSPSSSGVPDAAPAPARSATVRSEDHGEPRGSPAASAVNEAPAERPRIEDAHVAKLHTFISARLDRLANDIAQVEKAPSSQLDALAMDRALLKLIEAQRYWYLGPAAQMPPYVHLNSPTSRFWSTGLRDGRVMVIELSSFEFPEVFAHDPRVLAR